MLAQIGSSLIYFNFVLVWIFYILYWKDVKEFSKAHSRVKFINLVINSLLWIATILLVLSFLNADYSLVNVYHNVDNSMSKFDRFMATWASRAGAMMLWAFLQSIITVFALYRLDGEKHNELQKRTITLLLFFNALITSFALSSRPAAFAIQIPESDGLGLTPSLLNFWQQIHPPVAFLSYSAFTVPFVIGLVGLMKKSDKNLPEESIWLMDFFMMIGWIFTTLFIIAGSIWAYEVDWGGFWFWDPVQVSSFIMWIFASLYFHVKPLIHKGAAIHYLMATFGWVGVTVAAFVVRGGLIEGPHQYIGTAQLIVFSLLMLGTIFGVIFALKKSPIEVIPDWFFDWPNASNRYSVWTVWILVISLIFSITSITLNIIFFQLSLPLRDLSRFYALFSGIFLILLSFLLILCESEILRIPLNIFSRLLLGGMIIAFLIVIVTIPQFRFFSFILLVLITAFTLVQISQIVFIAITTKKIPRIGVRLIHIVILFTLFTYMATDPQTISEIQVVELDNPENFDTLNLVITLTDIKNGSPAIISVFVQNTDLKDLGILTLQQGIYQGETWMLGDWISRPFYDIYVKLSFIHGSLFYTIPEELTLLVKIVPWVNMFRFNVFFVAIVGIIGIWSRIKRDT